MNAAQRKYLIDEIKKSANEQVDALKKSKPESTSLQNYLLHAVMSNNFKIKSNDEIMEMVRQKALNAKEGGDNWMSSVTRWSGSGKITIDFEARDFFELPEEYAKRREIYKKEVARIDAEINSILLKEKGLITRITLASDKTLQKMINEVDDLGDLSLLDDSLKIASGIENKLLN